MKINDAFVMRRIKDDCFLVPVRRNSVSSDVIFLNQVGAKVFQYVDYCVDSEILCENISELYGVNEDSQVVEGIRSFIKNMIDIGLILE